VVGAAVRQPLSHLYVRTIQIHEADCGTRIKHLAAVFTFGTPESPHRVGDKRARVRHRYADV